MNRVVVTGLGAVTPVGNDVPTLWQALLRGTSGINTISSFNARDFPIRIAGEIKDFRLDPDVDSREAKRMARNVQYALNAVAEAVRAANVDMTHIDSEQVGVVFGSGAGGLELIVDGQAVLDQKGYRRVPPLMIANMIDDAASGHIAIQVGARGPNMAIVSACSTGGHNVGEAFETIRRGDADMMITGSSDATVMPLLLAGFTTMRGLASGNEHPQQACKPFDAMRDGFVVSEGAGALVLENLVHARKRGVPIIAELVGYGNSNDAFHMAASDEQGAGSSRAIRMALRKANIAPEDVDYINAHGTGTSLNDVVETNAIKTVFGEHAYRLAVSSTKSMLGHMMGAAGSVEAIVCVLAIQHGCIPPTINYTTPDPACDLDYVPHTHRAATVRVALSNSIGLGGHNSCLAFKHYQPE